MTMIGKTHLSPTYHTTGWKSHFKSTSFKCIKTDSFSTIQSQAKKFQNLS